MPKHSRGIHRLTTDNVREIPAVEPDYTEIQARAYELWLQRGCPIGSPEIDWLRAEQELRIRTGSISTAA